MYDYIISVVLLKIDGLQFSTIHNNLVELKNNIFCGQIG